MRLSLHFHQSSVYIFTVVDSFEFRAAQQWQMRAVWVLRLEHLHFCENKWVFGQLLTSFEFISQPRCAIIQACLPYLVFVWGLKVKKLDLSFFLLYFYLCFPIVSLSQSVSEFCDPVVSSASLSFPNLVSIVSFYFVAFPFLKSLFKSLVIYIAYRIHTLCCYHLFPISTTFSYPELNRTK